MKRCADTYKRHAPQRIDSGQDHFPSNIGLPSAYVSGYLRTAPRQGAAGLQGSDAMHAWVLVWCGSATGWIGLDPTNAMLASDDHVTLAVGRDYTDVAPIDGVIVASGGQRIDESVTVMPES
jgi:transglutaminase-like putative cysteine protease